MNYFSRTDGTNTIYPVASTTMYRNDNGTGAQTTNYAYTWSSGTLEAESVTVTYPTITTAQNGSNSAVSEMVVIDELGRPVWTKDAAGYINYMAYDLATGAVIKTIADVDTTQTGTFASSAFCGDKPMPPI